MHRLRCTKWQGTCCPVARDVLPSGAGGAAAGSGLRARTHRLMGERVARGSTGRDAAVRMRRGQPRRTVSHGTRTGGTMGGQPPRAAPSFIRCCLTGASIKTGPRRPTKRTNKPKSSPSSTPTMVADSPTVNHSSPPRNQAPSPGDPDRWANGPREAPARSQRGDPPHTRKPGVGQRTITQATTTHTEVR